MTSTPVERVRQAIASQLARYAGQAVDSLHETILIRDGMFCGRRFLWNSYEIVWFLEEDQVKFFGPCGNLLNACSLISFLLDVEGATNSTPSDTQHHRAAA